MPRKAGADMFAIEAMNGPFDGKIWPFEQSINIGRDSSSVQAVVPTDRTLAHGCADLTGLKLTDLGSSNGTFVDGRAISGSVIISPGQPFVVGRTMLRVLELTDPA